MPKVVVRKCYATGKLFESDSKFASHLRELRKDQKNKRDQTRFRRGRDEFFAGMRATCKSAEEIEEFIRTNWTQFVINAFNNYAFRDGNKLPTKIPALSRIKLNISWSDQVRNTHSAPLTGPNAGLTNWGGDGPAKVHSYPGWSGRLLWDLADSTYLNFMSGADAFQHTGLFTGTGSGGQLHEYDVKLFADDWPAMLDVRNRELVKKIVGFKDYDKDLV